MVWFGLMCLVLFMAFLNLDFGFYCLIHDNIKCSIETVSCWACGIVGFRVALVRAEHGSNLVCLGWVVSETSILGLSRGSKWVHNRGAKI